MTGYITGPARAGLIQLQLNTNSASPLAKAVPLIKASRSGALCLIGEDIFSAFRAIEVVRLRPADQIGLQYHIRAEGGLERIVHEAELNPADGP